MAGLSAGGGCGAGRGGGLRWLAEGRGIDGIALIWTFRLGFNKKKNTSLPPHAFWPCPDYDGMRLDIF